MSDTFGSIAPDELQPPPRNPAAPPDAVAAAIRAALQHNVDWAKVPGMVAQGVQPSTPGQWSEEDEFRKQHLAQAPYSWGPQTAFSEVFWPRMGTNVGGSGFAVGSGATMPGKAAAADVPALTKQLETALQSKNTEEFPTIFKSLADLSEGDVKALAKEFYGGGIPRSKKQALDQIWTRWRKLEEFRKNTSANRPAA